MTPKLPEDVRKAVEATQIIWERFKEIERLKLIMETITAFYGNIGILETKIDSLKAEIVKREACRDDLTTEAERIKLRMQETREAAKKEVTTLQDEAMALRQRHQRDMEEHQQALHALIAQEQAVRTHKEQAERDLKAMQDKIATTLRSMQAVAG